MSAPVGLRPNFSDLYGSSQLPVLEYLFRSELTKRPSKRDLLLNSRPTDRDIYQYSETHDLPLFNSVPEGSDYTFTRTKAGVNTTLTVVKYGLGISVSEELVDDGKFDLLGDMIRKLAKSGIESKEVAGANLFNNGFTASTGTLTADGLSLFNTAHTLPSGGTFANRPTTDVDLSPSSLDSLLTSFRTNFVGDSGIRYQIPCKYLIVAPANQRYAMEIVKSSNKADTANNNTNPFLSDNLEVVVWDHLTDTDAFFLSSGQTSLEENGLVAVIREGMQTKAATADSVGFINDAILYKSKYREVLAALHPFGNFGTAGA